MDQGRHYVGALVSYDGTNYQGFQYQPHGPSVQGTLEAALDEFVQRDSRVSCAGRTDTGVHANGQVVSVWVTWLHGLKSLQRAWNVHLPRDVVVRGVCEAPAGFHPRFSAIERTYRYTVWHHPSRDVMAVPHRWPLTDRYALFETRPIDVAAMNEAAAVLIGEHDFATFGKPTKGESTTRLVRVAEWQEVKDSLPSLSMYPGRKLVFTITANAFLRTMVRRLVGTLLTVGRGEWKVADVERALAARNSNESAPPAPPQGLVLENVTYPGVLGALFEETERA